MNGPSGSGSGPLCLKLRLQDMTYLAFCYGVDCAGTSFDKEDVLDSSSSSTGVVVIGGIQVSRLILQVGDASLTRALARLWLDYGIGTVFPEAERKDWT